MGLLCCVCASHALCLGLLITRDDGAFIRCLSLKSLFVLIFSLFSIYGHMTKSTIQKQNIAHGQVEKITIHTGTSTLDKLQYVFRSLTATE